MKWLLGLIILCSSIAMGAPIKDYGNFGHTFIIQERSLLEVLNQRLDKLAQAGKIAALSEKFQQQAIAKIKNPPAAAMVAATRIEKTFYYDPSYVVAEDLLGVNGVVIASKGQKFNPLQIAGVNWGEPLLFVDGTEPKQLAWALAQTAKIVLVRGSPVTLSDKYKKEFYFDQAGSLIKKLQITQVPARVTQEKLLLKIEEILL